MLKGGRGRTRAVDGGFLGGSKERVGAKGALYSRIWSLDRETFHKIEPIGKRLNNTLSFRD